MNNREEKRKKEAQGSLDHLREVFGVAEGFFGVCLAADAAAAPAPAPAAGLAADFAKRLPSPLLRSTIACTHARVQRGPANSSCRQHPWPKQQHQSNVACSAGRTAPLLLTLAVQDEHM